MKLMGEDPLGGAGETIRNMRRILKQEKPLIQEERGKVLRKQIRAVQLFVALLGSPVGGGERELAPVQECRLEKGR